MMQLRRFVFIITSWLLVYSAVGAEGPELSPAAFEIAPPGTTMIFKQLETGETRTVVVKEINGFEIKQTWNDSEISRYGYFGFQHLDSIPAGELRKIETIWPLETGKSISYKRRRAHRRWSDKIKVTGTEAVTVAAGNFDTYVVEWRSITTSTSTSAVASHSATVSSRRWVGECTHWFAPKLGWAVKLECWSRGTQLSRWELVEYELGVSTGGTESTLASRLKLATARALEVESATRLLLHGETDYRTDVVKKDGYEYCAASAWASDRGEIRPAIREGAKALFLGHNAGDGYLLAFAKRDLARAYSLAGYLDHARDFANEALAHMKGVRGRDKKAVLGPVYKVLGDVALREGRVDEAIGNYERAVRFGRPKVRLQYRAALANAYLANGASTQAKKLFSKVEKKAKKELRPIILRGLADVALAEGRHDAAAQLYREAVDAAEGSEQAYYRLLALAGVARARKKAGDLTAAIDALLEAVDVADQVRARFRSEEFKTGFFGDIQDIFDEAIDLLMMENRVVEAFELSERSRARALLDLVGDRVKLSRGTLAFADPLNESLSAVQVQSALPSNTALVSYHITEDRTYAWIVRSSDIGAVVIETQHSALAADAEALRRSLRMHSGKARLLANKLYEQLVRPLTLAPEEVMVVIAHGVLHTVPFQALGGPDRYLIEERPVVYAPSASVLVKLLSRKPPRHERLLALGNPALPEPALALPGAAKEVKRISALFPNSISYLGRDATKDKLITMAESSDVIHIAAHAEVDQLDPLSSVIHLAPTADASGRLEAHEIYRLNLSQTSLVTLSACETGLGRVSRGDELWGFTRTFLGAGASALMVSLWPVDDAATQELMVKFYQELRRRPAQEAIRQAQLELLANPRFSQPVFWAGFNLIGDPR